VQGDRRKPWDICGVKKEDRQKEVAKPCTREEWELIVTIEKAYRYIAAWRELNLTPALK